MKLDELVPVQIIRFDPVKREIVKPEKDLTFLVDNPMPKFFDLGYFFSPYVPKDPTTKNE
jgi:hypothetical protein